MVALVVGVLGGVLPLVFPLQIVAEEVSGTNDYVQLTFRAHKLDNKVKIPESSPPTQDKSQSPSTIPFSVLAGSSPGSWTCSPMFPGSVQQI